MGNVVYHQAQGIFDGSQLLESMTATRDEDEPGDIILDLTNIRHLDISESVLDDLGREVRKELPLRLRAIVASDKYVHQLRWFAGHACNSFQCVQVFDNREAARQWLRLDD